MSDNDARPRVLVIYESMFGNSALVAGAIVEGLRSRRCDATAVDVRSADPAESLDVDLVVVGAPTHAFSLSRPSTRADAVRQGAPASHATTGLREWLGAVRSDDDPPAFAVFDTRVSKVRRLPTAAARTAARMLRRRGFRLVGDTEAFLVEDTPGPLLPGELGRAVEWGHDLAAAARAQTPRATSPGRDPSS